jgi:hypothetical protein
VIPRLAALALAVALAVSAARADGVSVQAILHVRATGIENLPGEDVLYDRAARTFELSRYLVPSEDARYGSTYASLSLDGGGLGGSLRWRLAVDTGELRRRAFPLVAPVCWTRSGTGLADFPSTDCALYPRDGTLRPVVFPAEETRRGDRELTSNGRPFSDELEATLLVREAYAALSFGRADLATVRVGRKRVSVGDGFVYDDYATGAEVALDLGAVGPPFVVTASLFQPTRDAPGTVAGISPFVAVRADFLPSLFEHAGLFVAAHRDRTGSVAELFRGAIVERRVADLARAQSGTTAYQEANQMLARTLAEPLESDATLAWAGTSGRLAPGRGQRLAWTAALLRGRIERIAIDGTDLTLAEDLTLRGRLLSLAWDVDVGRRLGLGAFFLHLSGGTFPAIGADGEYRGFLGIAPFVTTTNLFFGGGLSESFAARQSTAPGVNGRGVTAPGLSLTFDATDALGLELRGAWLVAPVEGPYGGRIYGTEVDATLSWSPRPWLVVGAELDVLFPGDFFAGDETVYKTVLAVDLLTP